MIDEHFDEKYWRNVELFGKTCKNCGNVIKPSGYSSTGWTHDGGNWEGIRCQNALTGAQPATR